MNHFNKLYNHAVRKFNFNYSPVFYYQKIQLMQSALIEMKHQAEEEFQFSTNEVLKEQKSNRTLYYLPCYVRFKVKEIGQVNIEGLQGTVSGTLLFSFYYGNLDRHIVDQFVGEASKAILLQFSRQQSLQLKQDKGIVYKQDEKAKMVDFVVRQDFVCNLAGDVFYTPFQIINLYFTITIQSVVLDPKLNNGRRIDIKFNCMTSKEVVLLSYSQNCKFGNYDLMQYYLDSKFKNSEKNPFKPISVGRDEDVEEIAFSKVAKIHDETIQILRQQNSSSQIESPKKEDKEQKIKQFQYAHFRIPLYKYPGANLVSIFVPLWVLGFINLAIFFQEPSLSGRISATATLTLAFIAFIPTINSTIPQTPEVKLVEILVYMQTLASVLCLIQSIYIFTALDVATYSFIWSSDGFFIAALILNLINVVVVLFLYIVHKCYWEPTYNREKDTKGKVQTLKKAHWKNPECDRYFYKLIKKGIISVI